MNRLVDKIRFIVALVTAIIGITLLCYFVFFFFNGIWQLSVPFLSFVLYPAALLTKELPHGERIGLVLEILSLIVLIVISVNVLLYF